MYAIENFVEESSNLNYSSVIEYLRLMEPVSGSNTVKFTIENLMHHYGDLPEETLFAILNSSLREDESANDPESLASSTVNIFQEDVVGFGSCKPEFEKLLMEAIKQYQNDSAIDVDLTDRCKANANLDALGDILGQKTPPNSLANFSFVDNSTSLPEHSCSKFLGVVQEMTEESGWKEMEWDDFEISEQEVPLDYIPQTSVEVSINESVQINEREPHFTDDRNSAPHAKESGLHNSYAAPRQRNSSRDSRNRSKSRVRTTSAASSAAALKFKSTKLHLVEESDSFEDDHILSSGYDKDMEYSLEYESTSLLEESEPYERTKQDQGLKKRLCEAEKRLETSNAKVNELEIELENLRKEGISQRRNIQTLKTNEKRHIQDEEMLNNTVSEILTELEYQKLRTAKIRLERDELAGQLQDTSDYMITLESDLLETKATVKRLQVEHRNELEESQNLIQKCYEECDEYIKSCEGQIELLRSQLLQVSVLHQFENTSTLIENNPSTKPTEKQNKKTSSRWRQRSRGRSKSKQNPIKNKTLVSNKEPGNSIRKSLHSELIECTTKAESSNHSPHIVDSQTNSSIETKHDFVEPLIAICDPHLLVTESTPAIYDAHPVHFIDVKKTQAAVQPHGNSCIKNVNIAINNSTQKNAYKIPTNFFLYFEKKFANECKYSHQKNAGYTRYVGVVEDTPTDQKGATDNIPHVKKKHSDRDLLIKLNGMDKKWKQARFNEFMNSAACTPIAKLENNANLHNWLSDIFSQLAENLGILDNNPYHCHTFQQFNTSCFQRDSETSSWLPFSVTH